MYVSHVRVNLLLFIANVALLASLTGVACAGTAIDWMAKVYDDGAHNAFTDLVLWKGQYYLCFRHGASHLSMDGEIRVMRSPDMKAWTECGVVDTPADDRDPHFAVGEDNLHLFFGAWDLRHDAGNGVPGRGQLRSYMSVSQDGEHWAAAKGVFEPCWWLWRVRLHEGIFYSVAYYIEWPSTQAGEARLLRSEDGLAWTPVSMLTKDFLPDESDFRFLDDGSLEVIMRTCAGSGNALWLRSDPTRTAWEQRDAGVLVHSPALCTVGDRCFVAGRGRADDMSITALWELGENGPEALLILPSAGDTAYPGLVADPAAPEGEVALFITWYSQHESGESPGDHASIYAARVRVN